MIQAHPRTAGLQQMGYIVFLSFTHGHGRAERQFRATRLVKKEPAGGNYQYVWLRSGSGLLFPCLLCFTFVVP